MRGGAGRGDGGRGAAGVALVPFQTAAVPSAQMEAGVTCQRLAALPADRAEEAY